MESLKNIYTNIHLSNDSIIRIFNSDIDSDELVWHTDNEDRIILDLNKTNWMIQLDNEFPMLIHNEVYITKHKYHRLIKGNGDLTLKITKLN